ncbi:MAG: ATPase, T2SS/T4P/T4SS family [Pirellulales bacterium]
MPRLLILFATPVVLLFLGAAVPSALAQDVAWPDYELQRGPAGGQTLERGPGLYISPIKLAACWLLLMVWVKTTDWVNQDCQRVRQNYALWNSVAFFPFLLIGAIGLRLLPMFAVAYVLMVLAWLVPLIVYIVVRNGSVEQQQRVLTPEHLRYVIANAGHQFGMKIDATKKAAYEKGAPVELSAKGGADDRADNANLVLARQSPGYVMLKDLISGTVDKRADALLLDFTEESAAVRVQIDGVWHNDDPLDRESGDMILAAMKTLAALNAEERRKLQSGKFRAVYNKVKLTCRLVSQGTQTGERTSLKFDDESRKFHSFKELGMREKQIDPLLEMLGGDQGFVLFSSPPSGGLTTTIDVALEETDRLLRNFVSVEEHSDRERYIENVEVTTFNRSSGESPATVLPKLIRTYPDVIVVRDLADQATAEILCRQVQERRLIFTSVRAKSAPEAMLRVLALKVPPEEFAQVISCVLNQRLLRKLCPQCKVGFEPTPEMLKKLGIPAGRVEALYREPKPEEREKVCELCQGIGYFGRTALYQFLMVDETVRQTLVNEPKPDVVNKASRKAGMRTLQEEGILLVAKGVTSLQEVTRVLKQ